MTGVQTCALPIFVEVDGGGDVHGDVKLFGKEQIRNIRSVEKFVNRTSRSDAIIASGRRPTRLRPCKTRGFVRPPPSAFGRHLPLKGEEVAVPAARAHAKQAPDRDGARKVVFRTSRRSKSPQDRSRTRPSIEVGDRHAADVSGGHARCPAGREV